MDMDISVAKSSTILLGIYALNCTINGIGIIMNLGLVTITIRNRHFHSTCSLLIGFSSLCSILLQSAIFIPFIIVLLPSVQSVPMFTCFVIQLLPNYGVFSVISLMGIIGIDRLSSVFFPLWYLHRNEKLFLALLVGLSTLFPLLILWLIYTNVKETPTAPSLCNLGELSGQQTSPIAAFCLLAIGFSILCYLIIWAKLRRDIRKSMSQESINSRQPIFKSLAIILAIQVGGWCMTDLAFAIIYLCQIQSIQQWHLAASVNCFICVAAAADPIVLFVNSEEYRKAFCEHFPLLGRLWRSIGLRISPVNGHVGAKGGRPKHPVQPKCRHCVKSSGGHKHHGQKFIASSGNAISTLTHH